MSHRRSPFAALAAVAALLAGCTAAPAPDPPAPSPTARVVVRTPDPEPGFPSGTPLATAVLVAVDGSRASGTIELVADGNDYRLLLHDWQDPGAAADVILSGEAVPPGTSCFPDVYRSDQLPVGEGREQSLRLDASARWHGDPTFFRQLLVVAHNDGAPVRPDCFLPISAIADLAWAVPPLRDPAPVDSGPHVGAAGVLRTDATGVPQTYAVVSHDTCERIARRFGISLDDLAWLNPTDPSAEDPARLRASITLNLDPALRGIRNTAVDWSRWPDPNGQDLTGWD